MGRLGHELKGGLTALSLWVALGVPAMAQASVAQASIPVPSGQAVTWLDTINDAPGPEGLTIRFRFLAPAIAAAGGTISAEEALDDMAYLCENYALPRLPALGPRHGQIVISLSDRPVGFGQVDDSATQYFEAYSAENGICTWEMY